jgi:hypothetical protein
MRTLIYSMGVSLDGFSPVVLGGGTRFSPAVDERINLELVETRTFGSRVVYLCYRRV